MNASILLAQRSVLHGLHMSHFITCDSTAIDFDVDYSSFTSKAIPPFHLTEVIKVFNRFTSQRLLRLIYSLYTLIEQFGADKLIKMCVMQTFVVFSGKSVYLKILQRDFTCQLIFEDPSRVSNTTELAKSLTQAPNLGYVKNCTNVTRRKLRRTWTSEK